MTQPQVLVIGTSHTRAIADALAQWPAPGGVSIEARWLQSQKGDRVVGDLPFEEALERVQRLGPKDLLVLAIYGTGHNVYGLLQHEQPFWLAAEAGEPEDLPPPSGSVIPRRTIEAWMQQTTSGNKRVEAMLQRCKARRFHLMTPPPKGDQSFILARTKKYRDRLLDAVSIAPAEQRRRFWVCEKRALAAALSGRGVGLIDPPAQALTPEGFLDAAYYGDDATHANAAYGRLVVQQLAALAAGA